MHILRLLTWAVLCGSGLGIAVARAAEPIAPLTKPAGIDTRKAELGHKLFLDPRLSGDGTVSCASCHSLARGGADNQPVSVGIRGQKGGINAPTVYNATHNFVQFWDGRAHNLEEQIGHVVLNPKEFDSNWALITTRLARDSGLAAEFRALYSDGITEANIRSAIADFERTLVTPSRFDRYLQGEVNAISAQEKHGYELFKNYGCSSCHQGQNVGGNMFQVFGAYGNYFADRGTPATEADNGRYNVTKREADRHVFRVPSLRNVALTAPYFHDGTAQTLDQAVAVMFKYQLGRSAPQADKDAIIAFLKSLTGQHPLLQAQK